VDLIYYLCITANNSIAEVAKLGPNPFHFMKIVEGIGRFQATDLRRLTIQSIEWAPWTLFTTSA
jgi:hypothetical protein